MKYRILESTDTRWVNRFRAEYRPSKLLPFLWMPIGHIGAFTLEEAKDQIEQHKREQSISKTPKYIIHHVD